MFDPFGDFDTAGYLRNLEALKDPGEVAQAQHAFFLVHLEEAVLYLSKRQTITYADFCKVHQVLFEEFYPWAGRDRHTLGVGAIISKAGRVQFEAAGQAQRAVEAGLRIGNDPAQIKKRPGEVMGFFAWGHPFLDGNGRTMTIIHAELLHRAGFVIDWGCTRKNDYLETLTKELSDPRAHHLDAYLLPLLVASDAKRSWIDQLKILPGLDGSNSDRSDSVSYSANDAQGLAEYEAAVRARGGESA